MNSINSWINEDEVRKLAEDLTAAPAVPKELQSGDDTDGFALIEKQGQITKSKADEDDDKAQEMKQSKSSSLAEASARATSAGLIGKNKSEHTEPNKEEPAKSEVPVKKASEETQPVVPDTTKNPHGSDHYLNAVPVNVNENKRVSLPNVHPNKEIGTFEQIDQQLVKTVKAKGICVIDRDGDVLYSSMINPYMVAFTIEAMMGTELMQTKEGEFGNIRMKMSAGEYLEFVSVRSTRGVLVLAVVMNHVLGKANAQYVAGDVLKIADSE